MEPNQTELWAGLSDIALVPGKFELGDGVSICQTYAHLMSPFMMAFSPAPKGKHHPGPWKSVLGGFEMDVSAEIYLPMSVVVSGLDRLNTIWWIAALLRLRTTPEIYVPVISSEKFSSIPAIQQEALLWPMEIFTRRFMPVKAPAQRVDVTELEWLKANWRDAARLLSNEDFTFALQALDQSVYSPSPALAIVAVWGALERLFSSSNQELSFRVSANLAAFLEPPGRNRLKCFKQVRDLYNQRSRAAHGDDFKDAPPYVETYELGRRVLVKIIEARRVPGKEELEAWLFGDFGGKDVQNSAVQ